MTRRRRPTMTVVAGPNGAGKSTITVGLRAALKVPVLDPDAIARALSPDAPERAAAQAGREMIHRRDHYLAASESFIVETTLSGRTILHAIDDARRRGFRIHLIFVGVESPKTLVSRVAGRVAQGGHGMPITDIHRRYTRSMENLQRAVEMADRAAIFDNSAPGSPRRVATVLRGRVIASAHPLPAWVTTHLLAPLGARQPGQEL